MRNKTKKMEIKSKKKMTNEEMGAIVHVAIVVQFSENEKFLIGRKYA